PGDPINQIRACHQPADRKAPRPLCAADAARPRRRGDRMIATMNRREFITLIGGTMAAWPLAARAQQPKRMRRIGGPSPLSPSQAASPRFEAFRKALRELNHVEDKDVSFIYRWADGNRDRLVDFAAELASLKVDLIFSAPGTPTAIAAQK